MAYLANASLGIANSSIGTISFWFQLPASSYPAPGVRCGFDLFILGDNRSVGSYITQSIWFRISVAGYSLESGSLYSPRPIRLYASASAIYPVNDYWPNEGGWPPNPEWFGLGWGLISSAGITFGSWHHVIIAYNVDSSAGYEFHDIAQADYVQIKPFRMKLDGNDSVVSVYNHPTSGLPVGYAGCSLSYRPSMNPFYPLQCRLNGSSIALPIFPGLSSSDLPAAIAKRFGDFQMWSGQFIDPSNSSNYSKFVNITGGKGYPVDPSVATTAFGTQTFLFKGKSSDNSFFFNRGNGGAFSKIGTTADFTPTPSYG